jgi:hypothetical protein
VLFNTEALEVRYEKDMLAQGDCPALPDFLDRYVAQFGEYLSIGTQAYVLAESANDATVYSGILDIVLAILPWKIICCMTINRKEKLGAMVAMSMGVLYVLHPRSFIIVF